MELHRLEVWPAILAGPVQGDDVLVAPASKVAVHLVQEAAAAGHQIVTLRVLDRMAQGDDAGLAREREQFAHPPRMRDGLDVVVLIVTVEVGNAGVDVARGSD